MNKHQGINIVIVGGGWAGCAAAVQAAKTGAQVQLLERTDMLLGTGLVGGIMNNNGRYTAAYEMMFLGGGELFEVIDQHLRHRNVEFPGHSHADLYDIGEIEGAVRKYLQESGVQISFNTRISMVRKEGIKLWSVLDDSGNEYEGDAFVDTTGTAGPMGNCKKYGNGCAMCALRCPTFGGRISLAELAGAKEVMAQREDGRYGSMSGSCKLYKDSLSYEIRTQLEQDGVVVIPLTEELRDDHLSIKSCQQYAKEEFRDNLILLDTGHGKLMTPFFPLDKLHRVPGFEYARYEDPYAGGQGNSMRYLAMCPRENTLQVQGMKNLFCAGEKAGPLVGHTEAIVTGVLAGYNSVRSAVREELLELPQMLTVGDAINQSGRELENRVMLGKKYTFSGSVYFQRMVASGLYTTDIEAIKRRVLKSGAAGVFEVKTLG